MKDTLKRLTCMLLALIMVAGMFPVSVFAEAEDPTSDDTGNNVYYSNVITPFGAPETSDIMGYGTVGRPGVGLRAADAAEGTRDGEITSDDIMDFIPPGTISMIHKSDDSPVTATNPARPGETVYLSLLNVAETINGLQFDMTELSLEIPAGLEAPEQDVTGTSTVYVTDYSVSPPQTYAMPNTYVIGTDGYIRYIWKNPHTEERPAGSGNIVDVYGLACNAENFKFSLSFEITIGDDADSIDFGHGISFPVDRSVSLTVTKSIEIPGMSSISQDQAQQMTFALYYADGVTPVKDSDGNDITFTRNDMTPSGLANGEWSISGLIPDPKVYPAVFVVKETGHPEIGGYTFLTAGDNVVTEQTVEIPAGQSKTAALKNRYTKDVSRLKIKKLFPAGALNLGNLTDTQKALISFTVKDSNGVTVATATLAETNKFDANGEWFVGTLPPGEYTVIETSDLEGYTRYATYKVDTNPAVTGPSSGPVTAPVTLVTDQDHVVEFNNTYTEQRDNLKIKKTFAGAELTDAEKANIKFTITAPDGTTTTVNYSQFTNGEYTLSNVLTGTYKVVETNVNPNTNNYTVTSTYSVNGGTPQSGTSANSVPVTLNGTNEVDFTNTYTAVGKITLTKTVGGNYWGETTYNTQAKRRQRIRTGVTYYLYSVDAQGNRTQVGNAITLATNQNGYFYNTGTYTWSNLPVGNYVIEERISGTGSTGAIISNTIRTTTVTVNGGTGQTAADDATTISSGNFAVPKGGTSTVAYRNDYNKPQGKIKLDKKVFIDGSEVDPSTLTEAQQKAMKFTVTGKDAYGNNENKVVTLYDILHPTAEGSPLDANGYLVLDYSNSTGYTVTESGADIANYIRVTTNKKDNGEFGPGASASSVVINATTTEHTVTFKNEYTGRGRIKVDKTVSGLSAADEATVRGQIYFTIADTSGRPIVKDANGKYVLGQAGATPAQIPLAELTAENGIELPTGTYVLTEHNGDFNTEIYTWSVSNELINDQGQIDVRQSATSGNATVTLGNTKHVGYTNTYTRKAIGPGGGVSVIKHVLLDGVEIDASYPGVHAQLYSTVMANIRFKIYEGNTVDPSKLIEGCPEEGYTYAYLQTHNPILNVGTYTIQELNYNVDHYTHAIYFTVNGVTTRDDHVTITLTQDQHISVNVYNGYIPLGDLEVRKIIDESGDLKAADLTAAQKSAIKFSVIGYKDQSYSEIIWPDQDPDATGPQPEEFTYADMAPNADGVMSKAFHDIPIGVYLVEETSGNHDGDIPNYNVYTVEDPAGNALEVHWNTSGDETAIKTFTNKYTRQKGNLEVTKTFDAPSTLTTAQRRAITFTVTGPDPSMPQTFSYADMTSGHYTIENVITGTYTVTETNADFDFFVRTTTVSVNGGNDTTYSETSGVNASVENEATASVHFTNTYQETGALIINKTFDDSEWINELTAAQKNAITFKVYDSAGNVIKTITYAQILSWIQSHSSQDPAGYRFLVLPGDYTIEESNADFPGYVRTTTATVGGQTATVSDNDGVSATVVEFAEETVVFNNKYNEIGKLKVKKIVEDLTLNDDQKAAIKFTVTRTDPDTKAETVIAEFTYADILAKPNQEYVIENLPAGNYTVFETVTDEESVFYGKTRRTYVRIGAADWTENSTTVVGVDSKDKVVTFRNKYGNTNQLTVQKEIGGAPTAYIEKNDSLYPVWKFNLKIANLEPSTTSNGETDIIDYIDNKAVLGLFEVVTDPADLALIDAKDSGAATIANKLTTTEAKPTATVTLEEDYDQGKVTFHITGITADTATSNDLTYYLIPKDAEALATLNARAGTAAGTPNNQCKKYFANVAEYKKLPLLDYVTTNQVDYEYEKLVVKKSILNLDSDTYELKDEYGNVVDYAVYQFIINPEEMKLSTNGYIDVTDNFSQNQSVDQESITVERCVYDLATGEVTSRSPALEGDVTRKDLQGHSIVLTLRDEMCFVVSYTATLLYTADQIGTEVKLNNIVEVEGYSDGIEPTVIPSSHGGGSVYRIRLRKYEDGHLDNGLKGAEFKMYLDGAAAEAARTSGDYSQAIGTYTTDQNGVVTITQYTYNGGTHNITASVTYYFVESVAPVGYDKINYVVQVTLAAEGETADYTHYIYLPNDTVGIKDTPFATEVPLGALKTFNTNGSARQLTEGEFSFKIKAVNNAPMPAGTVGGEITVSNDAAGKALFGTIPYDTEDVITRDSNGDVTSTTKTFHYQVSEVLPDGLDANGNKNGVHYDTHVYEVAVTVEISNGDLVVTSVTVDGTAIQPDNNVYFVGLENEYTAEGTWTPAIQKDLQGRPLKEGEFTFQIKKGEEVLATGTNDANGNVVMDPASLTFTLDDLGDNVLTVHEVYTVETDDGMYVVAADETVTVTVAEKKAADNTPIYDGTLDVTSDKATLTAPLVMTNKFKASGSWHPKAEKTLTGALKLKAGDFEFELAAVGDAPMPEGSTNGKKVVACDADGKVDFGQIDFYQGNFDDVEYNHGNKTFQYTIKEVIPEPADRIFGLEYDDTVYNITVTTTINKTNKLGVAVTCDPEDGWDLDTDTATFTAQFQNTYGPTPAKAQPGYEKWLKDNIPSEAVTFEFKLEKSDAADNGDFDYVKVNNAPFATQTREITLGPGLPNGSGWFDEITFLAEGTYKFKITETPNTNGALDPHFVYDPKEYTYTVVVTGSGTALQATDTYSFVDEDQAEQTAEIAVFTNKYTPTTVKFTLEVIKSITGVTPPGQDAVFYFRLTPDASNPEGGELDENAAGYHETTAGGYYETTATAHTSGIFDAIEFTKEGTFKYTVKELGEEDGYTEIPGYTYDKTPKTIQIKVEDENGNLTITSVIGVTPTSVDNTEGSITIINPYQQEPVDLVLKVKKTVTGDPRPGDEATFTFTLTADENNPTEGCSLTPGDSRTTTAVANSTDPSPFSKIKFTAEGEYNFTVVEQDDHLPGYYYDTTPRKIKVTVTDVDSQLTLKVEIDGNEVPAETSGTDVYYNLPEFKNEYHVKPTNYQPKAKKLMHKDSKPLPEDKDFSFKMTVSEVVENGCYSTYNPTDPTQNVPVTTAYEKTITVTVKAGETASEVAPFEEFTYTQAGEYKFKVVEVDGRLPGITYTTEPVEFTVKVDDINSQLTVTDVTVSGSYEYEGNTLVVIAEFINKYTPEPTEYTPKVKKQISGEDLYDPANTVFKFRLTAEDGKIANKDGYQMPDDQYCTVEITGTELVAAGAAGVEKLYEKAIGFSEAGEYYFLIEELLGTNPRITYDPGIWELKVVVEDSTDAKLKVTSHVYTRQISPYPTSDEEALFSNNYTPKETYFPPKVTKVLEGLEYEGRTSEIFYFELKAESGNPDGATLNNPTQVSVTDFGTANFGQIKFEAKGTYKFTIKELVPTPGTTGYTYATEPWTLEIEIDDNAGDYYVKSYKYYSASENGESATAVITDGVAIITEAAKGAVITNKYKPIPTSYVIPVEKTINTDFGPTMESKTFTFELLTQGGPSGGQFYGEPPVALPNGTTKTIEITVTSGNTPSESKNFDKITYEKKGTYTYQITETVPTTNPETGIVEYSKSIWELTVVIANNKGQLEVESTNYKLVGGGSSSSATFENKYKPEPTEYTPEVTKKITIDFGPTVEKKFFYFNAKLMSQKNIAEEDITGAIYRISDYEEFADENNPNPAKAIKTNADVYKEPLKVEVPAGTTAATIIPGVFEQLKFVKAGTYVFEIVEKEEDEEGITYDKTVWTLTVVVLDNKGKLEVNKHEYVPDSEDADHKTNNDHADFTNPYEPTPTKYPPQVTKNITVEYGPTVEDKIFKFDIECTSALAADGKTDVMDGQVKSVDSKPYEAYDFAGATKKITVPAGKTVGTVTFDEIYYTKAGTYTYEITEEVSGEEGITDDTAKWTLVVVVTDTDGKLDATVTSPSYTSSDTTMPASDSTATFVNPYKPEPTKYAPQVIKNIDLVTGAPTSLDKTFKFYLEFITATAMDGYTDVSDGQLDAAEDAGGKQFVSDSVVITVPAGEVTVDPASFMTIHFTKAGIYSYRITEEELLPPELGMAYDGSVWILKVTVTDKDGKLEVTGKSYTNDPTVAEVSNTNAIFVNPYRTGILRVEKRVSGNGASSSAKFAFKVVLYTEELYTGIRTPLAGEYPVEIYDSKGKLVDTATVVNGTATFKLRHNQYALIKNVPIGVKWEVEEEKYAGYSTSMETPNKGTIGLMVSVSKWKNHRSTVPPVPRTGYGDGTTVKVGLGASLGVFLASAIGSIFQSKSTKKKKRGGGSHAAN